MLQKTKFVTAASHGISLYSNAAYMAKICAKFFDLYMKITGVYDWSTCFVFTVTCVIMQKNGAGLHTASSCFWDNTTDGLLSHFYT